MPNIRPFNALLPVAHLQERVVTRPLEDYSTGEAKLIASENDCSFLHLVNPELDNPYLRGTRQELVFKKISENFEAFMDQQVLETYPQPAIFIYRVSHDGLVQTGIWTITHIGDYIDGNIKKHELTVERRERLLADYLQQTRLDANPVLITHQPDPAIKTMFQKHTAKQPLLDFYFNDQSRHQVWAVTDEADLSTTVAAFKAMSAVYIADGHHRIAAMAKLSQDHYFTTVYMDTDEIKVLEFNRLIRDLGEESAGGLLEKIRVTFELEPTSHAVKPQALHQLGMYLDHEWYILHPKPGSYNALDPVDVLDVSILQNNILEPILGIKDPRRDARLTFIGGRVPAEQLQLQVDNGLFAVAFTLFPVSIIQLQAVADAQGVMPPKSTWVEPKFLVGLITQYLG